jgi:very-short-patch-repair endonuclease
MDKDWTAIDGRVLSVLSEHGGVAHVREFDAAGITRYQLSALLGRGVVERPRIGWYVDPSLPWRVKLAVRVGGPATCVTAAEAWGLPVPPTAARELHVHVEEHTGRLRHNRDKRWVLASVDDDPEVVLHRGALLDGPSAGRTSLIDTLRLLAACVSVEWFIAALDAALHRPRDGTPIMDATAFARLLSVLPGRLQHVVDLVDPRSESCLETLLRLGLIGRGVVDIVAQAVPHRAYRVDLLACGWLIIEADGAAFHDPERDRIRDDVLRSLGYRVLRFSYERIVFDLAGVLDEIEAVLAAGPTHLHG